VLAVAGLAAGGRVEVVALHVDDSAQPEDGRRLIADIACGLALLAVNARPELRIAPPGRVAAEIAAAAAEHGSDLVVLGSRGRADLGGLLPGSVAREVVERVPCPVLLVRAGRHRGDRCRRLLVALAGDEDPTGLVRTTAALATTDTRVLVLPLVAPGDDDLQVAASARAVEQVVAGLRRCGVRARGRAPAGDGGAAGEIARTALDYGADLVVTGSPRAPALAALLRDGARVTADSRRTAGVQPDAAGPTGPGWPPLAG